MNVDGEISADQIISLFIDDKRASLMTEESHEVDLLRGRVQSMTVPQLFAAAKLKRLEEERKISQYLCAVLTAFSTLSIDLSKKLRSFTYTKALDLIRGGKIQEDDAKQLTSHLMSNAHLLSDSDCLNLISFKMIGVHCTLDTPQKLIGLGLLLELAAKMCQRASSSIRRNLHGFLIAFNEHHWPGNATIMLASALVDASESEEECERSLQRIRKCVVWKAVGYLPQTQTQAQHCIEPEELPALFYHMVALGRNPTSSGGESAYLKSIVVDTLIDAVDCILEQCGVVLTTPSSTQINSRSSSSSSSSSSRRQADPLVALRSRAAPILSTIVSHLALVLGKDQSLVDAVWARMKNGRFHSSNSRNREVSLGVLMMCLLAACVPRQEGRMLKIIVEVISAPFFVRSRFSTVGALRRGGNAGYWLPFTTYECAAQVTVSQLQLAFERLVRSPLMTEQLAPPLIRLALVLIDEAASKPSGSSSVASAMTPMHSILSTKLHVESLSCLTSAFAAVLSPMDGVEYTDILGALAIVDLFCTYEFCRPLVVRELVLRLLSAGAGASTGGGTSSSAKALPFGRGDSGGGGGDGGIQQSTATCVAHTAVLILARLAHICPHGLLTVQSELFEAFMCIGELPPSLSAALVLSFSPLFPHCVQLLDRCTMTVRKVSFSRDMHCRLAAAAALTALMSLQLRYQLLREQNPIAIHHRPFEGQGLSIDECMALFRRLLQQQFQVRSVVYSRVFTLQSAYPAAQSLVLQLLNSHFSCLICIVTEDPMSVRGSRGSRSGRMSMNLPQGYASRDEDCTERIDLDSCASAAHVCTERLMELMITLVTVAKSVLERSQIQSAGFGSTIGMMSYEEEHGGSTGTGAGVGVHAYQTFGTNVAVAPAAVLSPIAQEAIEVCQRMWNIAISCSRLEFDEFGLAGEDDQPTLQQLCRAGILLEVFHVCMIVVYALPSNLGTGAVLTLDDRLKVSQCLVQRTQEVKSLLKAQDKALNKTRKALEKTAKEVDDRAIIPPYYDTAHNAISRILSSYGISSSKIAEEMPRLHLILAELHFSKSVLGHLHLEHLSIDEEEGAQQNKNVTEKMLDSMKSMLSRSALETCVTALDKLSMLVNTTKKSHISAFSLEPESHDDLARLGFEAMDPVAVQQALSGLVPLTTVLTRYLVVMLTDHDLSTEKSEVGSILHKDQTQLTLRSLLACIRLALDSQLHPENSQSSPRDVHTGQSTSAMAMTLSGEAEGLKAQAMRVLNELIRRGVHLAKNQERTERGDRPVATTQQQLGLTASALTGAPLTGAVSLTAGDGLVFPDLSDVRKNFRKIYQAFNGLIPAFLEEPEYDPTAPKNAQRKGLMAGADRLTILVSILSELMSPMEKKEKDEFLDKLLTKCYQLQLPTIPLVTAIIEMIVLAVPETPTDRLEAALKVATDIETCAQVCEQYREQIRERQDDDEYEIVGVTFDTSDEKDEVDRGTRSTYLSLSTLPAAIGCLVSILERAASDVEALMKHRDARFRVSAKRRMASKPRLLDGTSGAADGHISSDEEGNAHTHSSSFSSSPSSDQLCRQLDASIHETLCRLMRAVRPLLTEFASSFSENVLALLTRLLKMQTNIGKDISSGCSIDALSDSFYRLLQASSATVPLAGKIIETLQNREVKVKKASNKKSKKSHHTGAASKVQPTITLGTSGRQERIVPALVFQIEKAEVQVIALSNKFKNRASDLLKFIPPQKLRDFRVVVKGNEDDAGAEGERGVNAENKAPNSVGNSNGNGSGRRAGGHKRSRER